MGGSASVGYEEENEFQLLRDETLLLVDELTEDQDLRVMFVNYVKSGEWFVHVEGPKCTSKLTHEERLARAMKTPLLEYHGATNQTQFAAQDTSAIEKSRQWLRRFLSPRSDGVWYGGLEHWKFGTNVDVVKGDYADVLAQVGLNAAQTIALLVAVVLPVFMESRQYRRFLSGDLSGIDMSYEVTGTRREGGLGGASCRESIKGSLYGGSRRGSVRSDYGGGSRRNSLQDAFGGI
eukprot:CAMPEP_0173349884 /NCGR_PEP_ID=MMETSP1144-20121109/14568_1 /TAXON_ID=483371 /ORGANISM="non described non described, Strain CCMP2298" /LENGTH=234 /DNA_ID=CAMNT_0014297753 /DNA_START=190 /DNA_END=891 /DNA_ORIENTATION=-